jgi:L-fuconolactonase
MNQRQHRRRFLQTVITSLAGWTIGQFKARAETPSGPQPRRLIPPVIIDTHTHFYDPNRPQGVPWPAREDPWLYRPTYPRDYLALPTPQPVFGTVVVEASPWIEDNQWILDLAAQNPFIVGFVGNLNPGTDPFRQQLMRFAANRLFRGVRINADRLGSGLDQTKFRADLRLLADKGLALDLLGGPTMLPDVVRLARLIPNLRLVIDHVANLRIDGRPVDSAWHQGMRAAGHHRNVFCKVSGLVEGTGRSDGTAPRDPSFYKPVLDVLWNAFGEDRLVYGSNWPVSARFASLATVQGIVEDYFSTKGTTARAKVLGGNARTVYHWISRRKQPVKPAPPASAG